MSNILVASLVLFNYFPPHTGSVQQFTAPQSGTYKLEVWGAQGGEAYDGGIGGYGGYSYGNIYFNGGRLLYVVVGGSGNSGLGYNGGGDGQVYGGGATHISTTNRGELSNYSSYQSEVLIVAGGGGGGERTAGGNGGGLSGTSGSLGYQTLLSQAGGGTQTTGGVAGTTSNSGNAESGSFGKGGNSYVSSSQDSGGAGGGGWYGGGGIALAGGGGGGSGYLNSILMNSSMQTGVQFGDGYAKITQISF